MQPTYISPNTNLSFIGKPSDFSKHLHQHELGNKLYTLMKKRSNTAKDFYRSKSEAKYNDYLLYDSFDASKDEEDSSKNEPTPPTIS